MTHKLLISGGRDNFDVLIFDSNAGTLELSHSYPAPFNASWTEPIISQGDVDSLLGLSEGDDAGLIYTFEIDHEKKRCNITSQQPTLGAPAHLTTQAARHTPYAPFSCPLLLKEQ